MGKFLITILSLLLPLLCYGQKTDSLGLSNWRTKTIVIKENKEFPLDSTTVIPSSIEIFIANENKEADKSQFHYQYGNLLWKGKSLPDTLDIRYQVFSVNLSRTYSRLDTNYIKVDPTLPPEFIYDPYARDEPKSTLDLDGVNYTGSFERGIAFGNAQNLVLNSSLNLQMGGTLGDGIELSAAISDQNIPLQPEGNTQNIQDFDRVFIQIKKEKTSLIAGDFDMRRPDGYFMNYNKKLQGAKLENSSSVWGGEWKNMAAFAISGGKFSRQNLIVAEGNQGPYKLRGNDNELFIIVLSGTEKVFIDGILMKRGELNDYIIDYNRGEVTFTPNRLITKDSRVIVEFEYTDQNYLRFQYMAGSEFKKGKWTGRFNFYNEQDSKNSSGQQNLSTEQIQFLTDAGDNLEGQFAPGLDSLEKFTTDRITYAQIDTIVNGISYPDIIIYNTHPDSAKYTARFTEVGQNLGNYILSANAANGRVYQWVAPDAVTGQPQGNFEPVIKLVAPQRKQLLTLGGRYDIKENAYINVEGALSINDQNRFSEVDAADDKGTSIRVDYVHQYNIDKKDLIQEKNKLPDWQIESRLGYEYRQKYFRALGPYRAAEFSRDWNVANIDNGNEHLLIAGLKAKRTGWGYLSYDFNTFLNLGNYEGYQHLFAGRLSKNQWFLDVKTSYLQTEGNLEKTQFIRPRFDFSKQFKNIADLKFGIKAEREQNYRRDILTDTLNANSFYFDIIGGYIEAKPTEKSNIGLSYRRRWDYAVKADDFLNSTLADEVNIKGNWSSKKKNELGREILSNTIRWNMNYRNLTIPNSELSNQEALETYLGRIEHQFRLKKGFIRSRISYEIGSGQEPEREFVYQKVNDGEGVYAWLDRNNDSIPQLDEFEIAVFQDQANYLRIATITDRYVRSNLVQFSHSFSLEPRVLYPNPSNKSQKFFSKTALESSIKINRKVRLNDNISQWNPFELDIPDSSLVTLSTVYRATLFYNRGNSRYDIRMGLNHINNRNVLTTGFESRNNAERFLATRVNLNKTWSINSQISEGWREADSEFFDNKDYRIRWYEISPRISYQSNLKFRIQQSYKYQIANNKIGAGEQTRSHDLELSINYSQSSKTTFRSTFSYVSVDYIGETNTPVSFAMLEGLQNGNNYLWNLSLDQKLSKNLLMSLSYDGRKTGESNIIHTGRASVRANF